MSDSLVNFVLSYVRQLPGGLGLVTTIGCGFFSAIVGSNAATASAIGSVMHPLMKNAGYSATFRTGIIAVSSSLGVLIPPSLCFIFIASLTGESVGRLFMAGLFPGILTVIFLCILCVYFGAREGYIREASSSWRVRGAATRHAIPILVLPVVVLGGIYLGIFTATESAAVACVYSVILLGIYSGFHWNWKKLWNALVDAMQSTGTIYLLIASAIFLGPVVVHLKAPQILATWVTSANLSPLAFLAMILVINIILGCFMDGLPIIAVLVPIAWTPAISMGIDPMHFATLMVLAFMIGAITPPVGVLVFIVSGIVDEPIPVVFKGAMPFLLALFACLIVVFFFSPIATFLPDVMIGR